MRTTPAFIVSDCGAASRVPSLSVPERVQALIYKGRAELTLKLSGAAVVTAQLALTMSRRSDVHLLLADALRESGDCKRARLEYQRVLDLYPEPSIEVQALAGLKDCQAQPPVAARKARKVAQISTEGPNAGGGSTSRSSHGGGGGRTPRARRTP